MKLSRASHLGIFIAAVSLVVLALPLVREPKIEGIPLRDWIEFTYNPGGPDQQQHDTLIRQAGPKAIPTLIRMLKAEDTMMKMKLLGWIWKQDFSLNMTLCG